MHGWRVVVTALTSAVLLHGAAAARGGESPTLDAVSAVTRAGETDLARSIHVARHGSATVANALVSVLLDRGGAGAADALAELATHDAAEVRRTALEGLARLGVRTRAAERTASERAARDTDGSVRGMAARALGRVATGASVPTLLLMLEDPVARVRAEAHAALEWLSGCQMPGTPARWQAWWHGATSRPTGLVPTSGESNASPLIDPASLVAFGRLAQPVELEALYADVRSALRSSDPGRRGTAYALVLDLGLGDLADEVQSAANFESDAALIDAARKAARRVAGRPVPHVDSPPSDILPTSPGDLPGTGSAPPQEAPPIQPSRSGDGDTPSVFAPSRPIRGVWMALPPQPDAPKRPTGVRGASTLSPPPIEGGAVPRVLSTRGPSWAAFTWGPVSGATRYLVEVERAEASTWVPIHRRWVRHTSTTVRMRDIGAGPIRWRVRSANDTRAGSATTWRTLAVAGTVGSSVPR